MVLNVFYIILYLDIFNILILILHIKLVYINIIHRNFNILILILNILLFFLIYKYGLFYI